MSVIAQHTKSIMESLRVTSAVECVVESRGVRSIEALTPGAQWKVYRDLENHFAERAEGVEREVSTKSKAAEYRPHSKACGAPNSQSLVTSAATEVGS